MKGEKKRKRKKLRRNE